MYMAMIYGCEQIGQVLSTQISVEYKGNDSKQNQLAEQIKSSISEKFSESGYETIVIYPVAISCDGNETYMLDVEYDSATNAHEEWHSQLSNQDYTESGKYDVNGLDTLNESTAYAIQHFTGFLEKENRKDKKLHNGYVNFLCNFSIQGNKLMQDILENGITDSKLEYMKKLSDSLDGEQEGSTWATFMMQMNNLALYAPCIVILNEYGLEKGRDIFQEAFDQGLSAEKNQGYNAAINTLISYIPEEISEKIVIAKNKTGYNISPVKSLERNIEGIIIACSGTLAENYLVDSVIESVIPEFTSELIDSSIISELM